MRSRGQEDDYELALRDLLYSIGQAVHDRRTDLGWSQGQLAERAQTKQPHVSRLEGANNLPRLDLLLRVARALDTELVVQFVPRGEQNAAPSDTAGAVREGN